MIQYGDRFDVDVGDGHHLHVKCWGDGRPLVLLHGFTGSAETWATSARHRPELASDFTMLALDLPGHGRSGLPTDLTRYSLTRFADDLANALDKLQVDRAAVLGYSMGGRAALRFALNCPDRVNALVLESSSPGILDDTERAARVASDAVLADVIERDGIANFVDRWERMPMWDSQASLPERVRCELRAQRLGNDTRGLANSLRFAGAGAEPSAAGRLGDLHVPALLITGQLDSKYVGIARAMAAVMPSAELAIIADAGHAVHLERPRAFWSAVTRFLVPSDPQTAAARLGRERHA